MPDSVAQANMRTTAGLPPVEALAAAPAEIVVGGPRFWSLLLFVVLGHVGSITNGRYSARLRPLDQHLRESDGRIVRRLIHHG